MYELTNLIKCFDESYLFKAQIISYFNIPFNSL